MIEEKGLTGIEVIYLIHLCFGKGEIKDAEVLFFPLDFSKLAVGRDASLEHPSHDDRRDASLMRIGDSIRHRIMKDTISSFAEGTHDSGRTFSFFMFAPALSDLLPASSIPDIRFLI